MRIGYYCAALGTREQQKRLEVTANNIANANTAGYKKDTVRFQDFLVETSSLAWIRVHCGPPTILEHRLEGRRLPAGAKQPGSPLHPQWRSDTGSRRDHHHSGGLAGVGQGGAHPGDRLSGAHHGRWSSI